MRTYDTPRVFVTPTLALFSIDLQENSPTRCYHRITRFLAYAGTSFSVDTSIQASTGMARQVYSGIPGCQAVSDTLVASMQFDISYHAKFER
jgi:hypothetical protein